MSFRENLSSVHTEQVFLLEASPVFRREEVILIAQPLSVARNSYKNLAIETFVCFYCQCTGAFETGCEINFKTLLPLMKDRK